MCECKSWRKCWHSPYCKVIAVWIIDGNLLRSSICMLSSRVSWHDEWLISIVKYVVLHLLRFFLKGCLFWVATTSPCLCLPRVTDIPKQTFMQPPRYFRQVKWVGRSQLEAMISYYLSESRDAYAVGYRPIRCLNIKTQIKICLFEKQNTLFSLWSLYWIKLSTFLCSCSQ